MNHINRLSWHGADVRRRGRRLTLRAIVGAGVGAMLPGAIRGEGLPIRVGYAISRTGPWAPGAQTTQEPNYVLWAEQQNALGGIDVMGKRRPVQLQGSDDRSELETCIRTYERLMASEKVDLLLPPWGSTANAALAPLANRYGYPILAPTALSRRLVDMNLPYFFSLLQQADRMMGALVELLVTQGVKTIALIYMDDLFGLETFAALAGALQKTGIKVVVSKSYAVGISDLSSVLRAIKVLNPDAFVGLTYPADTILVSNQSRQIAFNPAFFYVSVGTAFPLYRTVMGPSAEGVIGMGSWNAKSNPAAKLYFDTYTARFGKEPDRWASGNGWAGLQILTQAVSRVGLDRKAIRDYVAETTFKTVVGPVRFVGSEDVASPGIVSQWQRGEFEVVWPRSMATSTLAAPKPPWL